MLPCLPKDTVVQILDLGVHIFHMYLDPMGCDLCQNYIITLHPTFINILSLFSSPHLLYSPLLLLFSLHSPFLYNYIPCFSAFSAVVFLADFFNISFVSQPFCEGGMIWIDLSQKFGPTTIGPPGPKILGHSLLDYIYALARGLLYCKHFTLLSLLKQELEERRA